jgi:hypothetical protein
MKVIEEIKSRLSKYPDVRMESDASSVTVLPVSAEGFSVALTENIGNGYTVSFEGWHEEFEDAEEAMSVFALGLSDECRLREYRRGGFPYKWTVEFWEDGQWMEQSTTGLFFFPFWLKSEVRYLQNKLLSRKE